MSVDYVTPQILLKNFSKENLAIIGSKNGIALDEIKPSKKSWRSAISAEMEKEGLNQLAMSGFKLAELEQICKALKIQPGGDNKPTRTVLQRRLKERMVEDGAQEFFEAVKEDDVAVLKIFIAITGEDPTSDDREELIAQAINVINYQGICNFLAQLTVPVLEELMDEAGLKYNTESKGKLIAALAGMHAAKKSKAVGTVEAASTTKLSLKSKHNLTYSDIYQHYNKEELVEFCRKKDLKVSGKKKEVVNRVMIFLNGEEEDKENIKKGTVAPAKKKSSGYALPTKNFSTLGLGPKKSKKKVVKKEGEEDTQVEDAPKKSSKKTKQVKPVDSEEETQVEEAPKKNDKKKTKVVEKEESDEEENSESDE